MRIHSSSWLGTLAKLGFRRKKARRHPQRTRRSTFEPLETRYMLAAVAVANNFDLVNGNVTSITNLVATPGADGISLREALLAANATAGADTITFDASLYANGPATITLAYDGNDSGIVPDHLYASNVTILGPGADKLILSGGGQTRVMVAIQSTIEGVTVRDGNGSVGGGIWADGTTLRKTRVTNNTATYQGGGIYASNRVLLIDSEVSDNTATNGGGGIFHRRQYADDALTIANSTISGNDVTSPTGRGGGVYTYLYSGYSYGGPVWKPRSRTARSAATRPRMAAACS
jgi:predicted outer membrane repeat protein